MQKKHKILIFCCALVILLLAVCFGYLCFGKYKNTELVLINETVTIEYGETYNPTTENMVDLSKNINIDTKEIKITKDMENEEGKEYPAVGEYTVTLTYNSKELNQKVIVKDTTSPEVTLLQESMEIEQESDLIEDDIKALFNAFDLAELEETIIDTSSVNINELGEYKVKIIVVDVNGNRTEKELSVKVIEAIKEDKAPSQNTSGSSKPNSSSNNSSSSNNGGSSNNSDNSSSNNNSSSSSSNNSLPSGSTSCNHSGLWFATDKDADNYFEGILKGYHDQLNNKEITYEEYLELRPVRYSLISCPNCTMLLMTMYKK